VSDPAVDVELTGDAADLIRANGGRLYLYMGLLGLPVIARASVRPPRSNPSYGFTTIRLDGVEILIQANLRAPSKLRVTRSWLPPHVRVEWDGQPWGWRFLSDTA
jgi:hypothetical protein